MTYGAGGWTYIAQRFDGTTGGLGAFLDFNLPLQDVNLEEVLSGHNSLSATITPEYPRLKGPDGKPILDEYGTAIWAESPDGEIRGGGLLTVSGFGEGGSWELECEDLTATAIDLPFTDATLMTEVDPMDVFRYIWTWIQQQRNHNLGITIDPATSPIRIGNELVQKIDFDTEYDPSAPGATDDLEPEPAPAAPSRYANNQAWKDAATKALVANGWNRKKVDDALTKWLNKDQLVTEKKWTALTIDERRIRDRAIEKSGWPPNPPSPGRRKNTLVVNMRPQVDPPVGGETIDDNSEEIPAVYEFDPYRLNWYENLDLDSDLSDLAARTPFDWHLTHRWTDNNEIAHHIRLGYPRLGRRREDLRFVVGENIFTQPSVERSAAEYANEVVVLGAGEGSSIVRGTAFRPTDGRVRKAVTISDPSITTQAAAIRRAELELAKRARLENVTEITIQNHPHAALGSIDLGDEILVEGDIGWIDFSIWCRVVARTMSPDDGETQSLTLLRSDAIL